MTKLSFNIIKKNFCNFLMENNSKTGSKHLKTVPNQQIATVHKVYTQGIFKVATKVFNIYRQYPLSGHIVGKSEKKTLILLTKFTFITDIVSTHA